MKCETENKSIWALHRVNQQVEKVIFVSKFIDIDAICLVRLVVFFRLLFLLSFNDSLRFSSPFLLLSLLLTMCLCACVGSFEKRKKWDHRLFRHHMALLREENSYCTRAHTDTQTKHLAREYGKYFNYKKKQTIDKKFDLLSSQKKNISIFSRILSYIDRTVYVNLNELMHRQQITSVHLSKLKSAVRHSHVRAQQAFQCLIRHHNGGFSYFPKLIS